MNLNDMTAPKPTTSVIRITPSIACRWLEFNISNRPIRRITIERYKRDMLADRWHFTGDSIGFDTTGAMINGQHRLTAISELPDDFGIFMNVTRGLDPESRFYMDQGTKRKASDNLSMTHVRNYSQSASGTRMFLIWKRGLIFMDNKHRQMISNIEVQDWVLNNPPLIEAANNINSILIKNDALPSVSRAAFFALHQVDPVDTWQFFHDLSSGAGLGNGDPVLALRERLRIDQRTKKMKKDREQLGLIVHSWNKRRSGLKLASPMKTRTWTAETFPEPK